MQQQVQLILTQWFLCWPLFSINYLYLQIYRKYMNMHELDMPLFFASITSQQWILFVSVQWLMLPAACSLTSIIYQWWIHLLRYSNTTNYYICLYPYITLLQIFPNDVLSPVHSYPPLKLCDCKNDRTSILSVKWTFMNKLHERVKFCK